MKAQGQYLHAIPELEQVRDEPTSSLYLGRYDEPYFERSWHHHSEYELLLITGGKGMRYVGDSGEAFGKGDLVLLGPRLPHAWISDRRTGIEERASSVYVQFRGSVFDAAFAGLPELKGVMEVLRRSARGLVVNGRAREACTAMMEALPEAGETERLLKLLMMLDLIGKGKVRYLSSVDYLSRQVSFKSRRMLKIHRYLNDHIQDEVSLDEAAALVDMTRTSFCRFFKNQTRLTFTVYANRLRVDFARKLLRDTEMHIKEIGYECGFTSIPYFNQVFRKYTGLSPREYRAIL